MTDLIFSVYLASPYSVGLADLPRRDAKKKRHERFVEASKAAAKLMAEGFVVFCPIAHTHPVETYAENLPDTSHEFWLKQDFFWLDKCDALFILDMPEWDKSTGIAREREFAKQFNIPQYLYDYNTHSWKPLDA